MKLSFPAIFEVDKEDSRYINVTIPDICGAVTFGDNMDDARYMAKDLLVTMAEYAQVTTPTSLEQTKANFPDKHVELVEIEI